MGDVHKKIGDVVTYIAKLLDDLVGIQKSKKGTVLFSKNVLPHYEVK